MKPISEKTEFKSKMTAYDFILALIDDQEVSMEKASSWKLLVKCGDIGFATIDSVRRDRAKGECIIALRTVDDIIKSYTVQRRFGQNFQSSERRRSLAADIEWQEQSNARRQKQIDKIKDDVFSMDRSEQLKRDVKSAVEYITKLKAELDRLPPEMSHHEIIDRSVNEVACILTLTELKTAFLDAGIRKFDELRFVVDFGKKTALGMPKDFKADYTNKCLVITLA